ncbi:hypothetical protein NDU88_004935 [Pleurodeles waltl]|uniref:Uncharacterized protein n=1 Tax=Pleurodeles waltl TaxID=8319 RepID=A0AAV7WWV2_PLEWA|nr:hypothetical protein NDU88_004935 [Pleurodeles waltl]
MRAARGREGSDTECCLYICTPGKQSSVPVTKELMCGSDTGRRRHHPNIVLPLQVHPKETHLRTTSPAATMSRDPEEVYRITENTYKQGEAAQ